MPVDDQQQLLAVVDSIIQKMIFMDMCRRTGVRRPLPPPSRARRRPVDRSLRTHGTREARSPIGRRFHARGHQAIAKTKGAVIDNEAFALHVVHCALDFLDMNPLVPADKAPDVFRNLVCARGVWRLRTTALSGRSCSHENGSSPLRPRGTRPS